MILQSGKQVIVIQILPNISRTKDNQIIKFCRNIIYEINII